MLGGGIGMGVVDFAEIEKFAAAVAREFSPERVVLFGSYATGNAKPKSDIDLLVIMPGDVSGVWIAAEIIQRLKPTLPVELIVRSSGQIRKRLALNDFFFHEIMNTGKELYAATHN